MTESDLRWIAEGPRPESDDVSPDSPIDAGLKHSFDALWISSLEARRIVAQAAGSRVEAEALLTEAMAGGTICTRGVPSDAEQRRIVQSRLGLSENDDFQKIRIEPSYWAEATSEDQSKWNWQSGDFISSPANHPSPIKYFDVEFPIMEVDELCKDNGLKENVQNRDSVTSSPVRNKGGRPTGSHGEPIAKVVIDLLQMKSGFNRIKVISLAELLREAYESCGETAPSAVNLEKISSGILKVVRHERNLR